MDINEQKRFVLIKDYVCPQGTLAKGSDITLMRGFVYYNGGLCEKYYANKLLDIVNNPKLKKEYLKETVIPINKI